MKPHSSLTVHEPSVFLPEEDAVYTEWSSRVFWEVTARLPSLRHSAGVKVHVPSLDIIIKLSRHLPGNIRIELKRKRARSFFDDLPSLEG